MHLPETGGAPPVNIVSTRDSTTPNNAASLRCPAADSEMNRDPRALISSKADKLQLPLWVICDHSLPYLSQSSCNEFKLSISSLTKCHSRKSNLGVNSAVKEL